MITLKSLRQRKGLKQKQVEELHGIPQSTLSAWELAKSVPSGNVLARLAKIYDCSYQEILEAWMNTQNLEVQFQGLDGSGYANDESESESELN